MCSRSKGTSLASVSPAWNERQHLHKRHPSSDIDILNYALTLEYLRQTGRDPQRVALTEAYLKAQGMYRVTLTKTIVNRAARVAFLTTGTKKARNSRELETTTVG